MTFTEAALEVLRREGKPLHFKKIVELAIRENLLDHVGKIPEETMADQLVAHARLPKAERRMLAVQHGTFALTEWGLDEDPAGIDNLVALMKLALKDAVKDVRVSQRLTDSAVCLVADEGDLDMRLARLLQQHKRLDALAPRVLEINGTHPLVAALAAAVSSGKGEAVSDAAWLLLDQARIQEGEALSDPAAFAKRLDAMMKRAFA